jgi:hypothetical protein
MTTLREAAQQALEALEPYADIKPRDWKTDREKLWRSYDALRAALAEPDEPIAWGMPTKDGYIVDVICPEEHARMPGQYTVPLYAHPYDQQALELCEVCGWKTLIPTEGCLNCERQPRRRLTNQEILDIGEKAEAVEGQHMLPVTFARAIEAAVWGDRK